MSLIDRLKREADQQRAQAEELARSQDLRVATYTGEIEPRMKALTTYLEGLAATLIEVKPLIAISLPIAGYGDLGALPFWDYKVEHERRYRSFVVTMNWTLRVDPERTPVVRADGVSKVKTLIGVFRHHHLGGIKEEKRTPQGELAIATFHARGYIKARMQAQISAEDPVLKLVFDNASWLGSSRRQVPWTEIDDSLFDRIARFLVREDDSLFTEVLSDEMRQRLRPNAAPIAEPMLPGAALAQARAAQEIASKAAHVEAPAAVPSRTAEPIAPAATTPAKTLPLAPAEPEIAYIPSMIPAPPPQAPDHAPIVFDESKLDASAFMSRMNVTLAKLRDEEDGKDKS